jgi:ATP-binding cassette subfamily C protein
VADVIRFGFKGVTGDLKMLLLMGVAIGLLGTLTPYFTGQIFDAAIPQAERGMLWGFGAALLCAAFATAMFHITQGVAILRAQGKMEYSIQAALWDRLLNLPANFFRKYSAGDLADRAAGIDAIQNLISGAGISAVLGSLSGVFYVFLMFIYDVRLALLAIVLTVTYVGITTLANTIQLRFQRTEIQMQGRIAGLVLNLITGVTKLRVCGAEDHAFRVWAQQFSKQRKISYRIGRIQNVHGGHPG